MDCRFEADFLTLVDRAIVIGDDNIRTHREVGCAAAAIFGGVVAQDDFDKGYRLVLIYGQCSGNGVALEAIDQRIGLVGVDEMQAQLGEIADLGSGPAAHQGCQVGCQKLGVIRRCTTRSADPRIDDGPLIFIGCDIELDSVPEGFGEAHRGECGPQAVGYGHGVVVLALAV